jgi:hypothetical protein
MKGVAMQFCPMCGVPVRAVAAMDLGKPGTMSYSPISEPESHKALYRFRGLLASIRETIDSPAITAQRKLELIESDLRRVAIDLPPAEPPPPERKLEPRAKPKAKPLGRKPNLDRVVPTDEMVDAARMPGGLGDVAASLAERAAEYDPDSHPANAKAISDSFVAPEDRAW